MDIHPAACIGCGIMLDHSTEIVIGETAVVENDVSILQSVTLGGTGKTRGDHHSKIREGVIIGAGSVVLRAVPARVVGRPASDRPSEEMDQSFSSPSFEFGASI